MLWGIFFRLTEKKRATEMIEFSEWQNVELKTAKILEVEDIPGKDKLYRLKVDDGSERQLVAGIRQEYTKEELTGKTIIIVANLKPATIAGIESNGMLLAVKGTDGKYKLLTADGEVDKGTIIE